MPDVRDFILQNLRLEPAPSLPEIVLYRAHTGSRLSRLGQMPPYWAYHWAGGTVLARYILDHPESVRGKRVIDLGCGSGVVAIAAMKVGALSVMAVDIDPNAFVATALNAEANGVIVTTSKADMTAPPKTDLILVGDLFYEERLAEQVSAFLTGCVVAGIDILVGDMGRKSLPLDMLAPLAEYEVPDFGQAKPLKAKVFRYKWPEGSLTP